MAAEITSDIMIWILFFNFSALVVFYIKGVCFRLIKNGWNFLWALKVFLEWVMKHEMRGIKFYKKNSAIFSEW